MLAPTGLQEIEVDHDGMHVINVICFRDRHNRRDIERLLRQGQISAGGEQRACTGEMPCPTLLIVIDCPRSPLRLPCEVLIETETNVVPLAPIAIIADQPDAER